ncbi:MAG: autoinducer binding domain-containing protein [Paracoccaceae bacterium]
MPHNHMTVKQVKEKLKGLSQLCDTGYLLAVHIRYTRPSLMFTTYPEAWLEHYGTTGMMMVDPVVRWAMAEDTPEGQAMWSDLAKNDPALVIDSAEAHGLKNGMSFAVGPITSRTIGSVTRSTPFSDSDVALARSLITEIHQLTNDLQDMDTDTQESLRKLR